MTVSTRRQSERVSRDRGCGRQMVLEEAVCKLNRSYSLEIRDGMEVLSFLHDLGSRIW